MSIQVIDLTNLVSVKETFRPGWRIGVSAIFLLFFTFFWFELQKTQSVSDIVVVPGLRARTAAVIGLLILLLGIIAFSGGNAFVRSFYATLALFDCLLIGVILVFAFSAAISMR